MLLVQSLQMVDTSNVTVAWTITLQSSKVNLILFIEKNSNDSKTIQSMKCKGWFFQLPGIPIAIVHGFSRKTVIPLTSSETIGKLDFHFSLPACRFSCSWTAVFTGAPFKKVTSQKQGRIKWFTSLQTFSRVCYNQEHVWFHGFSLTRTKIHGNLRYGRSQVFPGSLTKQSLYGMIHGSYQASRLVFGLHAPQKDWIHFFRLWIIHSC